MTKSWREAQLCPKCSLKRTERVARTQLSSNEGNTGTHRLQTHLRKIFEDIADGAGKVEPLAAFPRQRRVEHRAKLQTPEDLGHEQSKYFGIPDGEQTYCCSECAVRIEPVAKLCKNTRACIRMLNF